MKPVAYFSGSISGGREDAKLYVELVLLLRDRGVEVLEGEVTNLSLDSRGEARSDSEIFERDMAALRAVAVREGFLVAEVSRVSTGVGYEIAAARYELKIPVVCLWRDAYSARCTAMIAGDSAIRLIRYSEDRIDAAIDAVLEWIATRE